MAYDIKGDVTVARGLTAGSNITAAGYDINIPVTAATTGNPFNVDLFNGHRSFALVIDGNSTGNVTVNNPINVGGAKNMTLRLTNLDTVARTFVLSSGYTRADGSPVASITLVAGDTRVLDFTQTKTSPTVVWTTSADTGLTASGGLTKHGSITADADAGEGIYNLNASGGAFNFTLPTATGTQRRYIFVGETVSTNNVTLKVQVGESLNGILDGSYTVVSDGEMVLAIDTGNGKWDLTVLGASSQTTLHRTRAHHTAAQSLPAGTWTPIVLDTIDYDIGGMVSAGSHVTIKRTGTYRVSSQYQNVNNAVIHQTSIIKNSASISYAESTVGNGTISLVDNNTYELVAGDVLSLSAYCSIASNVAFAALEVIQLPDTETVMAGTVVPTPLGSVSGRRTSVVNVAAGVPLVMETTSGSQNITEGLTTTGLVTLVAGKTYKIEAGVRLLTTASSYSLWNVQTSAGVKIGSQIALESTNANTNNASMASMTTVYTPTANVDIGIYVDVASPLGDAGPGTYLTVTELPTASVVNPGMIVPKPLSRLQVSTTATTNIGVGSHVVWNETLHGNGSGLSLDAGGAILGLTAGNTYELEAVIVHPGLATGVIDVQFYDILTNSPLGEIFSSASNNDPGPQTSPFFGRITVTPVVNMAVVLQRIGGAIGDIGASSWMAVTQLSESTVVRPEDAVVTPAIMAKMSNSVAQTLTGNNVTQLVYDVVEFDNAAVASTTTNGFTIPHAGVYEITCNVDATNSVNSASYTVQILVNAVAVATQKYSSTNAQLGSAFNLSTGPLNMAATDTVAVTYRTNEANPRATQNGATANWVAIKQLSANVVN